MLEFVAETFVRAASDEDGNWRMVGFTFLAAGPIFYWAMYRRYRNTDKRHKYEAETKAAMDNMKQSDQFVRSMTRLRNSRMNGANNHAIRGARSFRKPNG